MQIELDQIDPKLFIIQSYKIGEINILQQSYQNSLIISPKKLITDWNLETIHNITEHHWQSLLSLKPDIIILGTGEKQHFLSPDLTYFIQQKGIGLEIMTNRSACFTYNALASESRNVALGIIL